MIPANCLRWFVLCLWLLVSGVNCKNPKRGSFLHVQVGHAPTGVHNDNRDYKRWREPPIVRIPTAAYKASSMERGQRGHIYPAPEDHITDSGSSQIQSHYPVIPERQLSNVPKSKVSYFKSTFNSGPGQSGVVYNLSGNKTVFPDGKGVHQAPPQIYRSRTNSKEFSPVQVNKAIVGFGPNNRKGIVYSHSSADSPNIKGIKSDLKLKSHKIYINPSRPNAQPLQQQRYQSAYFSHNSFYRNRTNSFPQGLKPTDKKADAIIRGPSPGSTSVKKQIPYVAWRPRVYNSDMMSEARGYAHVQHIKPGFDKTQSQASSAAGRKFVATGVPAGFESTKLGFDHRVLTSSEKHLNPNHDVVERAKGPVQGKFKPFQRRPTNNDPSTHSHSSDGETIPSQTFSKPTLTPSLTSTGITSTVVPSVSEELISTIQPVSQDGASVDGPNLEVLSNGSDLYSPTF